MGEIRVRVGPEGKAAIRAIEEFAILGTNDDVTTEEALKFVVGFFRAVDPRERDRVFAVLRRPRVLVPGR